jgi:hypothetical protein
VEAHRCYGLTIRSRRTATPPLNSSVRQHANAAAQFGPDCRRRHELCREDFLRQAPRSCAGFTTDRTRLSVLGTSLATEAGARAFPLARRSHAYRSWIADGNYGSIRERLWPKATQIIWLNYSLTVNIWRGLKRSVGRAVRGDELWHGNRESFRRTFISKECAS